MAGPSTGSASRLLALADSRLPTGAHAHSAGVEQAITRGLVTDVPSLDWFVRRRLVTSGLLAGAAAAQAASVAADSDWSAIDAAIDSRTPSPATRAASRTQGRGLSRLASGLGACVPGLGSRPHHAMMLGVLASHLGLPPHQAALLAVQLTATGITAAAQRLLALDPFAVARLVVDLSPLIESVATEAATAAHCPPGMLPDLTDPLADLLAEEHQARKDRFFVS